MLWAVLKALFIIYYVYYFSILLKSLYGIKSHLLGVLFFSFFFKFSIFIFFMAYSISIVVHNANNHTTKINIIIQFNPASQLPIKLGGRSKFLIWKAQIFMLLHRYAIFGILMVLFQLLLQQLLKTINKSLILLTFFGFVRINLYKMLLLLLLSNQ